MRLDYGQRGVGQARPVAPQSDVLGRWQTVPVGSGQQQGQQRERQRQHTAGPVDEKWGHDRFEAAQRARQSKHVRDYRNSLRDALKNFDYDS